MILMCVLPMGCFNLPIVSTGKVSAQKTQSKPAEVVEVSKGKSITNFDPKSTVATTIAAASGALAGSSITIPAGSLAISVDLVVERAVDLSQTSLTASLGMSDSIAITPIGSGLIIRPSANVNLIQPLTIAMPIDPTAGLLSRMRRSDLQLNAKYYAVFYKYFVNGELKAGVIPSSTLRFLEDGKVVFEGYFGVYWLTEVSTPIETKIEVKTEEPIVNIDNVAVIESSGIVTEAVISAKTSIPVVQWKLVTLTFNESNRSIELKAAIEGDSLLQACKVDLFESVTATTGINDVTDSKLEYSLILLKKDAHSLLGRFRCLDSEGRLTVSKWSAALAIPAASVHGPTITAGPSKWQIYGGQLASVLDFNDTYTGEDRSRDGDSVVYSCLYDNKIDSDVKTQTNCSTLVNADGSLASFEGATGVFSNWTPQGVDVGSDFEFKVAAMVSSGASSVTIFSFRIYGPVVIPSNAAPVLSKIANQVLNFNTSSSALAFNVNDIETAAADLSVTASSSNTALMSSSSIVLSGSGESRTVTLNPNTNQSGSATITVTVSDGSLSATSSFLVQVNPMDCPTNYVLIPADTNLATAPFCVMKYEAKYSNGSVTSEASGTPWSYLPRGMNSTSNGGAWKLCKDIGENYDLITNSQWQAIARNIESVASNWSNGSIGNDAINRGNSDESSSLAADVSDSNGCYGMSSNGVLDADCGGAWHINKRTHTLSNGAIIWDIAGNLAEWVQDTDLVSQGADVFVSQLTAPPYNLLKWGAAGNYSSKSSGEFGGLGFAALTGNAGAVTRGGEFNPGSVSAGVFASKLSALGSDSRPSVGFRCVMNANSASMRLPLGFPAAAIDLDADSISGNNASEVMNWKSYHSSVFATAVHASPLLAKAAINGRQALRFEGNGQYMQVAAADSPISNATAFTLALVFQPMGSGSGQSGSQWYQNTGLIDAEEGGQTNDWGLSWNDDKQLGAGIGNSDYTLNSDTIALNKAYVVIYTWDASTGSITLNVNGTSATYLSDAVSARNTNRFLIGSMADANFFYGLIANIKIFNMALTSAQINQLGSVLSQHYGISNTFNP